MSWLINVVINYLCLPCCVVLRRGNENARAKIGLPKKRNSRNPRNPVTVTKSTV